MSKALNATCQNGTVTTEGKTLTGPVILSEGIGPSTGVVLLDEEKAFYLVKGSPDLSATLTQIVSALNAISALFATMSPPVWDVLPGGAAAAATAKTAVDASSTALNTLKNNLR